MLLYVNQATFGFVHYFYCYLGGRACEFSGRVVCLYAEGNDTQWGFIVGHRIRPNSNQSQHCSLFLWAGGTVEESPSPHAAKRSRSQWKTWWVRTTEPQCCHGIRSTSLPFCKAWDDLIPDSQKPGFSSRLTLTDLESSWVRILKAMDWRGGLAVKSTWNSSRGPDSSS